MKKNNTVKSSISAIGASELLYGMNQYCEGVVEGIFSWTLDHHFNACPKLTHEQNAYDFLLENYDQLAGAFRMMAATTAIICEALNNEDLQISERGRKE